MSKKTAPVKEKKDSLNMVFLTWILSALSYFSVSFIVPVFILGEEAKSYYWIDWTSDLITIFSILIFSSLAVFVYAKEFSERKYGKDEITRKILVIASTLNVFIILMSILSAIFEF